VTAIVAGGIIAVFVRFYRTTVPIEREWMRELMAPEVKLGVVTAGKLDALAGSHSKSPTLHPLAAEAPHDRAPAEGQDRVARQLARDGGADTTAVQRARATVAWSSATHASRAAPLR